ncbi:hypothetical protein AWB91_21480 [Mycobacterium paraense]|uniref:Uncharacterized protein n=1 Tax=Mycobacterium paraense TaxID=767916 RepID=A0ABX3VJW5_9MYCO|nr:hypothetical protein [Mycobacterium paraense]MCV7445452.1 hypothetical protein [Mycobacterium paraense]ORW29968.1 hypothetical protein AWB91_21480 [Mycobacterium paraense]ORW39984.1 hypothetical protein AWB88_15455 [Mycobacterium paraense]ORW46597.1 hypothetical protein AWB89_10975 [Mycobacterium paraense]
MVTPTFHIGHKSRVRSARSARADGDCLRYRLDVVAASTADVVASAGGWLYDRVMAGWEVTVLLPHGCDTRALRILGVRPVDADERPDPAGAASHSLAVSAEAFSADARVREQVLEAMGDRLTELALWGDGWPLAVDRAMTRTQHVLSMAARRFKGYALAEAGIGCGPADPVETLLCDAATRLS